MIKNGDEEIRKHKLELETEITEKEIGRKTENKMIEEHQLMWKKRKDERVEDQKEEKDLNQEERKVREQEETCPE